jgi:hypothetical protein
VSRNHRVECRVLNSDLSRLHTILAPDFAHDNPIHREHRGYLREVVYTGSNFTYRNDWGPFHSDGTVDWTLVDALGSVMSTSLR